MSKVKITGNASGSAVYTLTTGTGSTDRVITLPDSTATLSTFNPDGAVVINESGADVDFRVESDTDTHSLFVDGASGTVGIGVIPEHFYSTIKPLRVGDTGALFNRNDNNVLYLTQNMYIESSNSANPTYIENDEASWYLMAAGAHKFYTAAAGTGTISGTKVLEITADGRGLSQFTAKAWINYDGVSPAINDSHNVSSVTDVAVGKYQLNFANAMGNTNYAATHGVEDGGGFNDGRFINHENGEARTTTAYGLHCLKDSHSSVVLDDPSGLSVIIFGD